MMRTDPELASLREREDFRTLLTGLEEKLEAKP
jgi:hypothetical protein